MMRAFFLAASSFILTLTQLSVANAGDDAIINAARAAETALKARVGIAVLDTGSGQQWDYRADERFPMASTFKTLACAALLNGGPDKTNATVVIDEKDLQSYAPVTSKMVGQQASAADLCAITLRTSDNTASNKVIDVLGGPSAITAFVRSTGDDTTRLDRVEPDLNEGKPGDKRDTTTPRAMTQTMQRLLLGSALDPANQKQLTDWLIADEVGGPLLRAAIPVDWRIADRTGAGGFGTRGVVAVIWPPKKAPIVTAIYLTETAATMDQRNAAIADIGKAIVTELSE